MGDKYKDAAGEPSNKCLACLKNFHKIDVGFTYLANGYALLLVVYYSFTICAPASWIESLDEMKFSSTSVWILVYPVTLIISGLSKRIAIKRRQEKEARTKKALANINTLMSNTAGINV
ncbi:MAG: hypothetical protein MHMPM18_001903 [Marteilia pararefringens]